MKTYKISNLSNNKKNEKPQDLDNKKLQNQILMLKMI